MRDTIKFPLESEKLESILDDEFKGKEIVVNFDCSTSTAKRRCSSAIREIIEQDRIYRLIDMMKLTLHSLLHTNELENLDKLNTMNSCLIKEDGFGGEKISFELDFDEERYDNDFDEEEYADPSSLDFLSDEDAIGAAPTDFYLNTVFELLDDGFFTDDLSSSVYYAFDEKVVKLF